MVADKQAERALRRIKMRTQSSPDRHKRLEAAIEAATPVEAAPAVETPSVETPSDKVDMVEPTVEATEETKPLSPQVAAFAKAKRALQIEREQFAKEKAEFDGKNKDVQSLEAYRARVKANALKVLQEEGVTYDQLTEQILASNQSGVDLSELRSQLKAELLSELKEETQKTFSSRDTQQEEAALTEMLYSAEALAKDNDDYALIRDKKAFDQVLRRIYTNYKKTGQVEDVRDAMNLVENQLLEKDLAIANHKKIQSRLQPQAQPATPAKTGGMNTKVMRTLTNRDGVSSTSMTTRERAIAAMEGRLK